MSKRICDSCKHYMIYQHNVKDRMVVTTGCCYGIPNPDLLVKCNQRELRKKKN